MRKHHNKLYFGRYRYKTEFKIPGTIMFYPTTNEHLITLKNQYVEQEDIVHLADFIMANRNKMKFRFQDKKSIFYSDEDISKKLIQRYWKFWTGITEVASKAVELSKNETLCKRLPHGKYRFQVHLKKDAQLYLDNTQKSNLWEFLERNVDNCLVTNTGVIDYLEDKCPYCFGGYFYVKEEKFLTPIYMLAQSAIKHVVKFVKEK
jgi:hypothetical protein